MATTWTGIKEVSAKSFEHRDYVISIQISVTDHTGGERETCRTVTRSASTSKYSTSKKQGACIYVCKLESVSSKEKAVNRKVTTLSLLACKLIM